MHHNRLISIALIVTLGMFSSAPVLAQEIGDATRGWQLAIRICSDCHWVRNAEKSGHQQAPTLSAIANTKGMSAMALNVALLTSHRAMPNIILDDQERADVIAFILTLKTK